MNHKWFLLILSCFIINLISGCGMSKPTADTSVKAIYELYILGDTEGVSKMGLSEENIRTARTSYDEALAASIRGNFSASGFQIDKKSLDAICQARKEALSRMEATYKVISEEYDSATVVLSTTYFDEQTLDTDAAYDAREAADKDSFPDYNAYSAYIMQQYTQNLIDAYHNVTPSEDTVDITVECVIVNNTWMPKDMASFGSDLASAISGQMQ